MKNYLPWLFCPFNQATTMEKLYRITINCIIRMPASADVVCDSAGVGEMDHIVVDGRRLRPEVRWLEYHARPPRELDRYNDSLWISVSEEVQWRYFQPAVEEWAIVEESPPSGQQRRKRVKQ